MSAAPERATGSTGPTNAPVIAFYISGHGFGHASRVIETMNAVAAARPDAELVVRTSAARWLFDLTVRGRFEFHDIACDTGVIQTDSLHLDIPASIREASAFMSAIEVRADAEAAFLRARGVTLVVGDLPPLAFEAAARAGVPSIATGNFTWDWIYAGYAEALAGAPGLVPAIRRPSGTPIARRTASGSRVEWRATNGMSTIGDAQSSKPPHIGSRSVSVACR